MNVACRLCRFWAAGVAPASPAKRGQCRRRAPVLRDDGRADADWPVTKASDGCGEFLLLATAPSGAAAAAQQERFA